MFAQPAIACPICMPLPRQTVADRLIAAEVVAFGRLDPEQPFSFAAVKILKGELAVSQVELFADSATRRQLAADESRRVLLVKSPEGWENLGVADGEYQTIVERILTFAPEWGGAKGGQKRLEYFLSLWNHENRMIFEMAYLELGKAPYSSIREFGSRIPVEELQPILTQRGYLEWRSLAILMLAQRDEESTRRLITSAFENCARFSQTMHLSAWATAYVELYQSEGVEAIERLYLKNRARSPEEIRGVLTALSVQGRQNDAALRARIVASYGSVFSVHPQATDSIVRDLSDWQEYRYATEVRGVLSTPDLKFPRDGLAFLQDYALKSDD
ncbi:MAG: hypothetical protein ACKV0T_31220 [Planctomycetales bacterium]